MQIKIGCCAHKMLRCNIMYGTNWKQPACPVQEQGTVHLLVAVALSFKEPSATTAGSSVCHGMKRKAPTCEAADSVMYIPKHVCGAWKATWRTQLRNIGQCSFSVSYF